MTLPASGSISLSQVNTELGRSSTATISLGESAVRTLFGVSSGAISMSNGYGKANQFAFTISSNQTNANLRTLAINAGWNQSSKVVATIGSGVYISSNSTGTPGLTINGSFPGGVELVNNGYIVGMGGTGGYGGSAPSAMNGANGGTGGTALSVSSSVSFTNNGTIAGGGGGGGGGGGCYGQINSVEGPYITVYAGGGGGGGGRTGTTNSSGGAGGSNGGGTGSAGTSSAAGNGANGMKYNYGKYVYAGDGKAGGDWGASGTAGTVGSSNRLYGLGSAGSGGSGGSAVSGNSNITWVSTGTRIGSIS